VNGNRILTDCRVAACTGFCRWIGRLPRLWNLERNFHFLKYLQYCQVIFFYLYFFLFWILWCGEVRMMYNRYEWISIGFVHSQPSRDARARYTANANRNVGKLKEWPAVLSPTGRRKWVTWNFYLFRAYSGWVTSKEDVCMTSAGVKALFQVVYMCQGSLNPDVVSCIRNRVWLQLAKLSFSIKML
jgi:hypothetical protein